MNSLVKTLWKQWGSFFRRYYHNLRRMGLTPEDLMNCEHCQHVGVEPWHCHNNDAADWALNVWPNNVCQHFYPNEGIICYEYRRWDGIKHEWKKAGSHKYKRENWYDKLKKKELEK